MKFCVHCGKEIMDEAVFCPHCGCPAAAKGEADVPSTGLNVLAFILPIVGFILFCVFHDKTPQKANSIGKWALISVALSAVLYVILYAGVFAMLM